MTHNQKRYTIRTPANNTANSPHKPKLTTAHKQAIKDYIYLATSYGKNANQETMVYYNEQKQQQRINQTLSNLGVKKYLKNLLENVSYEDFIKELWNNDVSINSEIGTKLVNIVKYAMTTFHLVTKSTAATSTSHERTYFIEYIIPGLMALAKKSNIIDFCWCEYELQAVKEVDMYDKNYNLMKTLSDMECVIAESSR